MSLAKRIKKLLAQRETIKSLVKKNLKDKYAGSLLGISWAVISPLLIMLAISFIFSAIFKIEIKDFSFFILSGIFPWVFFSTALSEATSSILNHQNILHQFKLPIEILPLSSVLANFLNFLIGWLIIYPLFLIFNPKIILLFPLLVFVLLLNLFFVCGLGMIFSFLNVFSRDIGQLLGILLMFWFWITPIFYSPEMVPQKFRWLYNFNPMTSYVTYYREVLFNGNIPYPSIFISVVLWSFIILILGFWFFLRFESELLKRV